MVNIEYRQSKNRLVVQRPKWFCLKHIFECGQNFRFRPYGSDGYIGVAYGRVLHMEETEQELVFYHCLPEEFESIWHRYFAFDEDYIRFAGVIDTDETMHAALKYGEGMRILKQDPWEMLISFIISQNNNIPRIKKIVAKLCEAYGTALSYHGRKYYSFPTVQRLSVVTEAEFRSLGLGYRSGYLTDAVQKIDAGTLDLSALSQAETCVIREKLMEIKGVGGKVADCILLFGFSRYEVCPHDVWVKRIFSERYHVENICEKMGYVFAKEKWKNYAGIAQQFLFYKERNTHSEDKKSEGRKAV